MNSQTNWEKIVSGQELITAKTHRYKTFIASKERRSALPELREEGWEEYKKYADEKYVGVKKDKLFDEQFEDRVWSLFAKMGFGYLNSDRKFAMSYDFQNPSHTQQIDVFAADEETILIVECKASKELKECDFKKQIEALHGQMEGLAKEARQHFPKRKIKFIWATHNCIMSKADLQRLQDWDIAYFSDTTIDYYTDLVKHLGSSAKYQLLGNLFANVEIKNMEEKIPAIQGKMGGFTYYSFSIEPERLLKICYVLHRNEANKNMMPTYQRLIKKKRLQSVHEFIEGGGYFPNSLIISLDTNNRGLRFEPSPTKVDGCISKLGILYLPKKYRSAYIIDGQHRLYGYSDSHFSKTNSVPVVAFVNLDRSEQIKLFMDINENQKSVPKTLRVTLNSDMLWESEDYNNRRQAIRSKIAQMLGEQETSPLYKRVVIGEDESSPVKSITVEALQTALKRSDFLSVYGKKNVIIKDGTFDLGENQETCDLLYEFLEQVLQYVKKYTVDEWNRGNSEDGMITMNRGIQAIIRVINDIVNHLISYGEISPKKDKLEIVIKKVEYYLDPLIDFLNGLSYKEKKDLRGFVGGGADARFWRVYQKAIADARNDFSPEGMDEYWLNQGKQFNQESIQYIVEIKQAIKSLFETILSESFGKDWLIKALPKPIYQKIKGQADDHNYDATIAQEETSEVSPWDFATLNDCRAIALSGSHWSTLFEKYLVRPEEKNSVGNKEAKTKWLIEIESISNKLQKPTYSVSIQEFDLLKTVHVWLCGKDE